MVSQAVNVGRIGAVGSKAFVGSELQVWQMDWHSYHRVWPID